MKNHLGDRKKIFQRYLILRRSEILMMSSHSIIHISVSACISYIPVKMNEGYFRNYEGIKHNSITMWGFRFLNCQLHISQPTTLWLIRYARAYSHYLIYVLHKQEYSPHKSTVLTDLWGRMTEMATSKF